MRRLLIIGIGAGHPEQVTVQAIKALNRADVFFVVDKGDVKKDLMMARQEICERYIENHSYRVVSIPEPERDRTAPAYRQAVEQWRGERAAIWARAIEDELRDGGCGALLVWGDPALYDSTIRIIDAIIKKGGHDLEYEVIPGISSIQALAAQHKIPLNRIGESIEITTGRRIAEGFPDNVDTVVVMLDAEGAYKRFADQDIDIYWGAYIGTPDEILVSGKLKDVAGEIDRIRTEARKANGWIMDSYLMRRNRSRGEG